MSRSRKKHEHRHRESVASDSSDSSSPERGIDDDGDSMMDQMDDSETSLGVSVEDIDLDRAEYEERCRLSPISRLPAELLIGVFSKLPSSTDVRNCMLVSKSWARNSVDLLWHKPSTSDWNKLLNVVHVTRKKNAYFAYHDLIKRLNLAQLSDQVSDGTVKPLEKCNRIERLTLTNCTKLTDESVSALINGNRALLAVDVSGLDFITDESLYAIANNCYRLQGLNITKCLRISDASLVEVAKNCRRVKRLKLNECPQITDLAIINFADHCHEILEIDLHGCYNVTDMSVTSLINECRQLRELRLAQCVRITDEAFLRLSPDRHFDTLRILDLTDCNELQDNGLQKIVNAAPRLRNLVLAKCRNISDQGVLAIAKLGKNLHYIHLGHCNKITDRGVNHLVKFCNRIRYIDLACCQNLTDESVTLLAILPKLKRIGLVKCTNITDRSIIALAAPKPSGSGVTYPNNLERLHLSYCANLTIRGVRTMLMRCPQLTHLSLTGVHEFLREDLVEFCRDAPVEFNEHQRDVFCVFSGQGVIDLRKHLQENYASTEAPSEADTDDGEEVATPVPGFATLHHGGVALPPMHQQAHMHANAASPVPPPPPHHFHHHHGPLPPAYNVQILTPSPGPDGAFHAHTPIAPHPVYEDDDQDAGDERIYD